MMPLHMFVLCDKKRQQTNELFFFFIQPNAGTIASTKTERTRCINYLFYLTHCDDHLLLRYRRSYQKKRRKKEAQINRLTVSHIQPYISPLMPIGAADKMALYLIKSIRSGIGSQREGRILFRALDISMHFIGVCTLSSGNVPFAHRRLFSQLLFLGRQTTIATLRAQE